MDDQIDANRFVDARSAEIEKIEAVINKSTKKSLLFQRLPFHQRRRTRGKLKIKKSKRTMNRSNLKYSHPKLRTHVYFAKRFRMLNIFNSSIPYERNQKSHKFIYKSEHRGFLFDESYKQIYILRNVGICRAVDEMNSGRDLQITAGSYIQTGVEGHGLIIEENKHVWIEELIDDDLLGYCVFNDYVICSAHRKETIFKLFPEHSIIKQHDVLIAVYAGTLLPSVTAIVNKNGVTDDKIDDFVKYNLIEENLTSLSFLCIKSNTEKSNIIITSRSSLMLVWEALVVKGYIPISILELLRFGLEKQFLVFPFDYPNTNLFDEYEKASVDPLKEKYDRTPDSKKVNYYKNGLNDPWFIPNGAKLFSRCFFTMDKGKIERMALIKNNKKIVGYVLRGGYCFSIGKCRGLCIIEKRFSDDTYLYKEHDGGPLHLQNLNQNTTYLIKLSKT